MSRIPILEGSISPAARAALKRSRETRGVASWLLSLRTKINPSSNQKNRIERSRLIKS